jgi:hypothetical protein
MVYFSSKVHSKNHHITSQQTIVSPQTPHQPCLAVKMATKVTWV